jgi:hypothetical protein
LDPESSPRRRTDTFSLVVIAIVLPVLLDRFALPLGLLVDHPPPHLNPFLEDPLDELFAHTPDRLDPSGRQGEVNGPGAFGVRAETRVGAVLDQGDGPASGGEHGGTQGPDQPGADHERRAVIRLVGI